VRKYRAELDAMYAESTALEPKQGMLPAKL